MAQWEERDPRWLVTELGASGSNVNNWHWEEKSKMAWSRQRIQELTEDLEAVGLDPEVGSARLTGIEDLTGEAYLTRRKGNKTLVVYDLSITISWTGKIAAEDSKEVTGTVKITDFALGSDEDDYIFETTIHDQDAKYSCLISAVKAMRPQILKVLVQFDEELRSLQQ